MYHRADSNIELQYGNLFCVGSDQPIWKAVRATGAAPYFFDSFGPFTDGGLLANNPTLEVMSEIIRINLAKCPQVGTICTISVFMHVDFGLKNVGI